MAFVIMGSICLGIVIILSILMLIGLPLGELTMGGRFKVFPSKLRIVLAFQLMLQIGFVFVLFVLGGYIPVVGHLVFKILGIVLAVYLSINSLCNMFSPSLKERYLMTPLSIIAAVSFWCLALMY